MELPRAVESRKAEFSGWAYVDYAFPLMMPGRPANNAIAQIKDAIAEGIASFKVFTSSVLPRRDSPDRMESGHLWAVMSEVAKHGGIMVIHAEDDEILLYMVEKLRREGETNGITCTWSTTTSRKAWPSVRSSASLGPPVQASVSCM